MSRRGGAFLLSAALLLAGCATNPPPKKAAVPINEDPYPSTYHAYPGTPTVIRGATIFDGEGGQVDNGTIVLADGVIHALPQVAQRRLTLAPQPAP